MIMRYVITYQCSCDDCVIRSSCFSPWPLSAVASYRSARERPATASPLPRRRSTDQLLSRIVLFFFFYRPAAVPRRRRHKTLVLFLTPNVVLRLRCQHGAHCPGTFTFLVSTLFFFFFLLRVLSRPTCPSAGHVYYYTRHECKQ